MCSGIVSGDGRDAGIRTRTPTGCCTDTGTRWTAEAGLDGADLLPAIAGVYRRGTKAAWHDPIAVGDLAIDGGDLLSAGIAAGPGLGKILRALLELVIDDPRLNQRDVLLARAAALAATTDPKEEG